MTILFLKKSALFGHMDVLIPFLFYLMWFNARRIIEDYQEIGVNLNVNIANLIGPRITLEANLWACPSESLD